MTETKLELIELSKIQPSTTNPRKEFEENSLKELAESIKKHGVLQPIVVRPAEGETFEIICGERRYRASRIADLESIPATIRNVDDDQAFEMQIIENLERKDVHPLDEAEAFKAMLDSGKYTITDIAAKVAKNESYVAQRLKLNDLIPEIKTDFYSGELGIGQAIIIAKLSEDGQNDIAGNFKGSWNIDGYGTVKELNNYLDKNLFDLNKAIFDINDTGLIPEAGDCTSCSKCTQANPTLFPDEQENICYDTSCYLNKRKIHILNLIEKTINEQPEVLFLDGSYGQNIHPDILSLLDEHNLKCLKNYDDFNYRESGKHKGLYISGSNIGKTVNIDLTVRTSKNMDVVETPEEQIKKIEDREVRAKELDREKIYKRIINDIVEDPEHQKQLFSIFDLTINEKHALIYSLTSWSDDEWLAQKLGIKEDDLPGYGIEKYKLIQEKAGPDLWLIAIRRYLRRELCKLSILDYGKQGEAAAYYNLINEYFPEQIKLFTEEQNKVAEKRNKRVKERISDVKKDTEAEELPEEVRICRICGCTDNDCSQCVEKTGEPCYWVEEDLCSACVDTVGISTAITNNAKLVLEAAKMAENPAIANKLFSTNNEIKTLNHDDVYTQKSTYAKQLGYNNLPEAIADMGKVKFEKEFKEHFLG